MVDFAPKLSTEVQPIQAVERTSAMTGVANIIQGFLPTKAAPAPDTPDETKKKDTMSFYTAMDQAKQAREQGKDVVADKISRQAFRTYGSKYGYNDPDVNASFQDFTGVPVSVEVNGEMVADTELMKSPDYQGAAFLAQSQNPQASAAEIQSIALGSVKAKAANNAAIAQIEQQKQVNWYDVEKVYTDRATLAGNDIRATIDAIQKDKVITPDEAAGLRSEYMNNFGGLQKPQGVPDDKWKAFEENYITPLNTIVEGAVGLGQNVGISQDMGRALNQVIAKAVSQGKLPASLLIKMGQSPNGTFDDMMTILKAEQVDPKFSDNYNTVLSGSFDDLMKMVTEFSNITPDMLDEVDTTAYSKLTPDAKRDALLANTSAIGLGEGDPGHMAIDVNDVLKKTELLESSALQPEDFSRIFSQGFFGAIDKIYQENPLVGQELADRAIKVVASQQASISAAFNSEAKQRGLTITNGVLAPDTSNPTSIKAAEYVDRYFGGSWDRAVAAGGNPNKFLPEGEKVAMRQLTSTGLTAFQSVNDNMTYMKQRTDKFTAVSKQLDILQKRLPQSEQTQQPEQTTQPETKNGYKVPTEVTQDKPFMDKVNSVSADFNINPNDMLRVIEFETGKSFDPAAKNPLSSATGLIQFMDSTAKGLGTSTTALAGMTRAEQMDYVAKYLAPYKGKIKNFGDLYMAVHWPKAIGKDESYVMYEKGSKEYKANINLDTNGDGTVTRGETIASVMSRTGGGAMMTPNTQAAENFRNTATSDITQVMPPSEALSAPTVDLGGAPTAPVAALPASPETTPTATQKSTSSQPNAPVASDAVQALVAKLSASPDQTFKTEQEFLKAVDAGELTAGESVVVDGAVYLIRKDGTPELIGNVQ